MGTAKVIFLSGLYIVIGMYTVGFNRANDAVRNVATYSASRNQAEQIARTGLQLAVRDMNQTMPGGGWSNRVTLIGGTVNYSVTTFGLPANQVRITSTGTYNGQQVTVVTLVKYMNSQPDSGSKKRWNSWQVVQTNMSAAQTGSTVWN